MINFIVIDKGSRPPNTASNSVYLRIDYWNDHSYVTMFDVFVFDEFGIRHDLPNVKIGFRGQTESLATFRVLDSNFTSLSDEFFSVGVDVEYYKILSEKFTERFRDVYAASIRDVAYSRDLLREIVDESVFLTSHLRTISINTIENQFRRVLFGGTPSTDYNFEFSVDAGPKTAGCDLKFQVYADSTPRTNVHAIIGRNGVGKTTLLNAMIKSIVGGSVGSARFLVQTQGKFVPISSDYFSSLISISFSAFDPFDPPEEQVDPAKGTCYFYVGLKKKINKPGAILKSLDDLYAEFIESLQICLSEDRRRARWLSAISTLGSDDNFAEMNLHQLGFDYETDSERSKVAYSLLRRMSSGHAIVLLSITKIVARLEEKTLVLFDEPESHLHPPLLSALIRCLSELLYSRNAVAIIATHSPVVLQEIPKSCVWKIVRAGLSSSITRPESETFGENVGLLTRDIFGLEVSKSGFNALLAEQANILGSYEKVLGVFQEQIGFEGRAVLRSIMHAKSKK